ASGKTNGSLDLADNNSSLAANRIRDDTTLFYRPASTAGQPEQFEYRMALPQYLYTVTVRMAVIAQRHPNLATESDTTAGAVRQELAQHASRIAWIVQQMEAAVDQTCSQYSQYDDAHQSYLVCTTCSDPISGY